MGNQELLNIIRQLDGYTYDEYSFRPAVLVTRDWNIPESSRLWDMGLEPSALVAIEGDNITVRTECGVLLDSFPAFGEDAEGNYCEDDADRASILQDILDDKLEARDVCAEEREARDEAMIAAWEDREYNRMYA